MSKVEPSKLPIFGKYRINFSGCSSPYGSSLSWQAIPCKDVHDSYHVMGNIVEAEEISTKKRTELLLRIFDLVGYFGPAIKKKSQWHSAEHRVIRLLKEKKTLNLENARKISDFSPNCGVGNSLLQEPEDFQLLEVLEIGKEIRSQVEKFIETGELPNEKANSNFTPELARKILSFPGSNFLLPVNIRRKLLKIGKV